MYIDVKSHRMGIEVTKLSITGLLQNLLNKKEIVASGCQSSDTWKVEE